MQKSAINGHELCLHKIYCRCLQKNNENIKKTCLFDVNPGFRLIPVTETTNTRAPYRRTPNILQRRQDFDNI